MAGNPQINLPRATATGVNNATTLHIIRDKEYVWAIEYSDKIIRIIRESFHEIHPKIKGYLVSVEECKAIIHSMTADMQMNVKCIQVKNPYYEPSSNKTNNQTEQTGHLQQIGIKVEKYDPVAYATKNQSKKEEKQNHNDPNTVDLSTLKDFNASVVETGSLKDPMKDYKTKKVIVPLPEKNAEVSTHEYIDAAKDLTLGLFGILAPTRVVVYPKVCCYLAIPVINIVTEDVKAILDCTSNGKYQCPSTSKILKNAWEKTQNDLIDQFTGDIGSLGTGQLFKSIAMSGTKREMIQRIKKEVKQKWNLPTGLIEKDGANIAQIGEAHFSIISGEIEAGKRIANAFGEPETLDDSE